jgi:hypothetical protein
MTDLDADAHHNSVARIKGPPKMEWMHELAYFAGGAVLTNAIPHFVSGVMGRPFQSPFATPRGEGLSSSTVNVAWGFFNLVLAYLLICRVGVFNLRATLDAVALGLGMLLPGLALARRFGRFNGGNSPESGKASY